MMPSPSELKYFLEVANTQNMSRAAERLGISQPALTLAMKRLEDSFGQSVLIRSKTGVRLTRGGTKLVGRVRFLLEEWEKIRDEAEADESELRGAYSIGCHPSVGLYTLPHFMPDLLDQYPKLDIKLYHDLSRKMTEGVISSRIDFGLVVNPTAHPDLVIKPLLTDEVTFYTSSKPTQNQDPTSDNAVLICDMDLSQAETLLKQMNKKGLKFRRIVNSSNLEVITSMVANGAGIGILPGRVANRDKSLGLKVLNPKLPKFSDKCCLVYRADSPKSLASKTIVKFITDKIKKAHA